MQNFSIVKRPGKTELGASCRLLQGAGARVILHGVCGTISKIGRTAEGAQSGRRSYHARKAFALASEKHKDQKRKSGEPFIIHPVAVATMLAEMDMDMPSVIAGMLHDVVEDTSVTIEEIREIFGDEIAYLVDGVTKLKRIPTSTKEELQNENLRKMFLSMASDIRVIDDQACRPPAQ